MKYLIFWKGNVMKRVSQPFILLLAVLLLVCGAMTTGCALGDRSIALTYEPVTATPAAKAEKATIAKFDDLRSEKQIVGEVRNGYGMIMAHVLIKDQDAGAWVSNALCSELQKDGCTVVTVTDAAQTRNGLGITGSIQELYTKMYMTYDCTVRVKITATRAGIPMLNKEYVGKGSGLAVLCTSQEYEAAVRQALQDVMKQAVPEILAANQ